MFIHTIVARSRGKEKSSHGPKIMIFTFRASESHGTDGLACGQLVLMPWTLAYKVSNSLLQQKEVRKFTNQYPSRLPNGFIRGVSIGIAGNRWALDSRNNNLFCAPLVVKMTIDTFGFDQNILEVPLERLSWMNNCYFFFHTCPVGVSNRLTV